jgi:hypothetical protein
LEQVFAPATYGGYALAVAGNLFAFAGSMGDMNLRFMESGQ